MRTDNSKHHRGYMHTWVVQGGASQIKNHKFIRSGLKLSVESLDQN
jgi:hypothetical protein